MKKFTALFLALFMVAGFASADEIGLTAGFEFGIRDLNKPNDEESIPYIEASIEYEGSFLDDALDIYAGLAYDTDLKSSFDDAGEKVRPNGLDFDIIAGYNLGISDASTLTFILENEIYFDFSAEKDGVQGIFKPGVKFNYNIDDIGDLYAQTDIPLAYLYFGLEEYYTFAGLDLTFGWASTFGLGLEAGAHILFSPSDKIPYDDSGDLIAANGFTGLSFTASYETGPIYAEIATTIPLKNLDVGCPYSWFDGSASVGMAITPLFRYTFDFGLSAYASITFDRIGMDGDKGISAAIGATYSF